MYVRNKQSYLWSN